MRQKIIDAIPIGLLGQPAEMAHLWPSSPVKLLLFMTGSNVAMNGGQHMY